MVGSVVLAVQQYFRFEKEQKFAHYRKYFRFFAVVANLILSL